MSEYEATKEEFKEELVKFCERIEYAQEIIDFTEDETHILAETAFYVNKAAILIGSKTADQLSTMPIDSD